MNDWYSEYIDDELFDDFYGDEDQNDIMRIINSYIGPEDVTNLPHAEDASLLIDPDELPF